MEAKNLKQFIALKERYESITLEDIKEVAGEGAVTYEIKKALTGFGNNFTCSLCCVRCYECVYNIGQSFRGGLCTSGNNEHTYNLLEDAKTPEDLLQAYRLRAKHMETLLK
jgi:hypothetical protein